MTAEVSRYWAVIPAAGAGLRMGSAIPKQYLKIHGRTVLEHSLEAFCKHPDISGIMVVLADGDPYWDTIESARYPRVSCITGGAERCHSVYNGLKQLARQAAPNDWVLVHDAARPCLRGSDITLLIETLRDEPVGGILALPVRDTMKRSGPGNEIIGTVERSGLWHALTPQMFRLASLQSALEQAMSAEVMVTDEAQAMELTGATPKLVQGQPDNIKITHGNDLPLAEFFLTQQERNR